MCRAHQLRRIPDEGDCNHGDGDGGDFEKFEVMQFESLAGVAGEEPTVLDLIAGIINDLVDVDPALLEGCGDEVKRGEAKSQGDCERCAQHRSPGVPKQRQSKGECGEQIAGDDAERGVGKPGSGEQRAPTARRSRQRRGERRDALGLRSRKDE